MTSSRGKECSPPLQRRLGKIVMIGALCALVLLSGCWDIRYLDKLGIVVALGVDDDPTGKHKLLVTAQFVLTQNVASGTKQGAKGMPVTIYTESGDTMFEAIRKMTEKTSRRLFFSHTQIFIIGEAIAREGIYPLLDLIERNPDIRTDINVGIARDVTAKQLLQTSSQMEPISALQLLDMIDTNEQAYGTNYKITVQELIRVAGSGKRQAVLPSFRLIGNREVSNKSSNTDSIPAQSYPVLSTMAVFRDGKLLDYLQTKESRGLAWMQNKIKSTFVKMPCPTSEGDLVVEIRNASSKYKVTLDSKGMPEVAVEMRMTGGIREIMCPKLNVLEEDTLNEIGQLTSTAVKEEVEAAIHKSQKLLKTDVLHWGKEVYDQQPKLWKRIEAEWPSIFPKVNHKIVCLVKIVGSGSRNDAIQK